jgi:hypothetical protein
MTREQTFKTPLRVVKRRYYLTWWILIGIPMFYILWPKPIGSFNQTTFTYWRQVGIIWVFGWTGMHGITLFMSLGMQFWGVLVNSSPAYEQWLRAGGHPFWDTLYFFNNDPPQVRAAIGIPPQYPVCFNCGGSLTGMFGLGSTYGNVCAECGQCNDTFPPGDNRAASFLG